MNMETEEIHKHVPMWCNRGFAKMLIDHDCISINSRNPFTLTSGNVSPVYVDCRRLISFPIAMWVISTRMKDMMESMDVKFDTIAGGATAGIPFASFLAFNSMTSMAYIRKSAKEHGIGAGRIEGVIEQGSNVLLVEDLMSEGSSKIDFVNAIVEHGAKCNHVFTVVDYGVFPMDELNNMNVTVHSLCTWHDIIPAAVDSGIWNSDDIAAAREFLGIS